MDLGRNYLLLEVFPLKITVFVYLSLDKSPKRKKRTAYQDLFCQLQ